MRARNLLRAYLDKGDLSYEAFARSVGADRSQIYRCATGQRRPGLALALAIEKATSGAVPASSWADSMAKPRHARRVAKPAA